MNRRSDTCGAEQLKIWEPIYDYPYDTVYVQVYVSKRDVYLTYICRADVLIGDMVNITIKEEVTEYDWRPVHHIGEVMKILDEQEIAKIRKEYWFDSVKLAIVCGREKEETGVQGV